MRERRPTCGTLRTKYRTFSKQLTDYFTKYFSKYPVGALADSCIHATISAHRLSRGFLPGVGFDKEIKFIKDISPKKKKKNNNKIVKRKKKLSWRLNNGLMYNCFEDQDKLLKDEYGRKAKKLKRYLSVVVDGKNSI